MKRRAFQKKLVLYAGLLLPLGLVYNAYATDWQAIQEGVLRIIVADQAENKVGTGTGFIVSKNGYIVTNYHVVSGGGENSALRVIFGRDHIMDATIVKGYQDQDLAVIKVQGTGYHPLPLADGSTIAQMQEAVAIGFPGGGDISEDAFYKRKITKGTISALVNMDNGLRTIQVDTPINSGNSGGPLLNADGEVIGVNFIKSTQAESTGWAIHVDEVKDVLQELGIRGKTSSELPLRYLVWALLILLTIVVGLIVARSVKMKTGSKLSTDTGPDFTNGIGEEREPKGSMTCTKGEFKGNSVEVGTQGIIMGRDPSCAQLVFRETKISKQHARITFRADTKDFLLEDFGSTNGTYIRGQKKRITQEVLRAGDFFVLGKGVAEFRVDNKTHW